MSRRFFLALLTVILLDQMSKFFWAHFGWQMTVVNQGVSFGWLGTTVPSWVISLGLVAVLVGVVWWLRRSCLFPRYCLESGMFVGGAVSNLADRLVLGGVRDWCWVPGLNVYNNLADWAIFFAVVIVLGREFWSGFRKGRYEHECH